MLFHTACPPCVCVLQPGWDKPPQIAPEMKGSEWKKQSEQQYVSRAFLLLVFSFCLAFWVPLNQGSRRVSATCKPMGAHQPPPAPLFAGGGSLGYIPCTHPACGIPLRGAGDKSSILPVIPSLPLHHFQLQLASAPSRCQDQDQDQGPAAPPAWEIP